MFTSKLYTIMCANYALLIKTLIAFNVALASYLKTICATVTGMCTHSSNISLYG